MLIYAAVLHCLLLYPIIAGLRSKMGAGYTRMNDLTVIQTTQVKKKPSKGGSMLDIHPLCVCVVCVCCVCVVCVCVCCVCVCMCTCVFAYVYVILSMCRSAGLMLLPAGEVWCGCMQEQRGSGWL